MAWTVGLWPPSPAGAILAPVALFPLFHAILSAGRWRDAALTGSVWSWTLFYGMTPWLVPATKFPWLVDGLLIAGGAFYGSTLAAAIWWLGRRPATFWFIVGVIPCWEWLRATNPFLPAPYLLVAHTAAPNALLRQWADGLGVHGLGALLVLTGLLAARWFSSYRAGQHGVAMIRAWVWGGLLAILLGGGWWKRYSAAAVPARTLRVTIVQEPDPRWQWGGEPPRGADDGTRAKVLTSSLSEAFAKDPAGMLVLAESALHELPPMAVGSNLLDVRQCLDLAARADFHGLILVGVSAEDGPLFHNRIMLLDPTRPDQRRWVDKIRGAPVGEGPIFGDFPLARRLARIMVPEGSTLAPAEHRTILPITPTISAACSICFEHMRPDPWWQTDRQDRTADWLFVAANLRPVRHSEIERLQSRCARRLAAVAARRSLVYAATGGSEVIGSVGNVIVALDDATSCQQVDVPLASPDF